MRAVVQRVLEARVEVAGNIVGAIGPGLLVYVGIGRCDTLDDGAWTIAKIVALRIFEHEGKMARAVGEAGGSLLLVSQFTLYGDLRRGRRPSFDDAMPPEAASAAYDALVAQAQRAAEAGRVRRVATGRFRAEMRVFSVNDGPVTLWLDSSQRSRARGREPTGDDPVGSGRASPGSGTP